MGYVRRRRFGLRKRFTGRRRLGRRGGATSTTRFARIGRRPARRRFIQRGRRYAMKQYLRAAEAKTSIYGSNSPSLQPPPMNTLIAAGSTQWSSYVPDSYEVKGYTVISPFAVSKADGSDTLQDYLSEKGSDTPNYPLINGRYLTWRSLTMRLQFYNQSTTFPICVHLAWVTPRRRMQPLPNWIMPVSLGGSQQNTYGIQPTVEMPVAPGTLPGNTHGPWIDYLRSRDAWVAPTGTVSDHLLRLDRRFFKIKWTSSFVLAAATAGVDGTIPGVAGRPPHKIVNFRRFYPSGWTLDYHQAVKDQSEVFHSLYGRPPSMLIWWHPMTQSDPIETTALGMSVLWRTTYSDPN